MFRRTWLATCLIALGLPSAVPLWGQAAGQDRVQLTLLLPSTQLSQHEPLVAAVRFARVAGSTQTVVPTWPNLEVEVKGPRGRILTPRTSLKHLPAAPSGRASSLTRPTPRLSSCCPRTSG